MSRILDEFRDFEHFRQEARRVRANGVDMTIEFTIAIVVDILSALRKKVLEQSAPESHVQNLDPVLSTC